MESEQALDLGRFFHRQRVERAGSSSEFCVRKPRAWTRAKLFFHIIQKGQDDPERIDKPVWHAPDRRPCIF
jgi:hypothetical protein